MNRFVSLLVGLLLLSVAAVAFAGTWRFHVRGVCTWKGSGHRSEVDREDDFDAESYSSAFSQADNYYRQSCARQQGRWRMYSLRLVREIK